MDLSQLESHFQSSFYLPWMKNLADKDKVQKLKETAMKNTDKFIRECFKKCNKPVWGEILKYGKFVEKLGYMEDVNYGGIVKVFCQKVVETLEDSESEDSVEKSAEESVEESVEESADELDEQESDSELEIIPEKPKNTKKIAAKPKPTKITKPIKKIPKTPPKPASKQSKRKKVETTTSKNTTESTQSEQSTQSVQSTHSPVVRHNPRPRRQQIPLVSTLDSDGDSEKENHSNLKPRIKRVKIAEQKNTKVEKRTTTVKSIEVYSSQESENEEPKASVKTPKAIKTTTRKIKNPVTSGTQTTPGLKQSSRVRNKRK